VQDDFANFGPDLIKQSLQLYFMKKLYLLFAVCCMPLFAAAQLLQFEGRVVDQTTQQLLADVLVSTDLDQAVTDTDGSFFLELSIDVTSVTLVFSKAGYVSTSRTIEITNFDVKDLGTIGLAPNRQANDLLAKEDQIPSIIVTQAELDDDQSTQDISGLLAASRNTFQAAAAFAFGPARFRIRGLDSENTTIFLNGVPMNDLENGRVYWSTWGGLNDVMRNRTIDIGLKSNEYTFGGLGGGISIDTRASNQRKQLRASYAISNRSYRNRVMLTYNTGMLDNGWAFSFSGSRRWADEGYVQGTFYDAYSYFASVDRKLNDKHMLNLTAFDAIVSRGRSGAAIQELYDLAGSNYYNPYWGFQNGEKRNSRISRRNQPTIILRHDWSLSDDASITTSASYQFGPNGSTAIDWYGARDPRPNYYRYLPSFYDDPENSQFKELVTSYYQNEENRQLNWDYMYNANFGSEETIEDVDGIEGNDVTGKRSKYIVEERRYDSKEFNINSLYQNVLSENISLTAGIGYQYYEGDVHKVVNDLLGGDFYVDIDRFAEQDFPDNPDAKQNDLNNPNRLLGVGDRFGYDYNPNVRKAYLWMQSNFSYSRWDFFIAGDLSHSSLWRTGDVINGRFPDNSFGDSEKKRFFNYGAKGGATYKIDQRNYFFLNGMYQTRAPFIRNAFVSPRTRNEFVDNLQSETLYGGEVGYSFRSPKFKAGATFYYNEFRNRVRTFSFFNDEAIISEETGEQISLGFVNFTRNGIDQQHMGTELSAEWNITSALQVSGVAAIGQYIYSSRPTATIINDNDPTIAVQDRTIYQKNFYIPGTPQTAYTAGLRYQGKKFWFANLNFNYFDNVWLDFNPNRRTEAAVFDLEPGSEQWNNIIFQEKGDPGFTVDFFGGKSFKFGDVFLYLNVGVSNILDNQDFITGGYEQLRFDFETQDPSRFPTRYYYLFGRNYFINLSLRL
jgi:hypothetical protein